MITIHSITESDSISPRQDQAWRLLCEGKPNKVIAHEMGCALATAKVHIRALMKKTGTKSRVELVRLAATEGRL